MDKVDIYFQRTEINLKKTSYRLSAMKKVFIKMHCVWSKQRLNTAGKHFVPPITLSNTKGPVLKSNLHELTKLYGIILDMQVTLMYHVNTNISNLLEH